ncbi:MAG: hypothetical protein ACYC4R_14855 [Anaerolineae bacterium]
MTKHKLFIAFGILLLLVVLAACKQVETPPSIVSTTFARDYDGKDATNVFAPDDSVYCLVKMANYKVLTGRDETEVKAIWKNAAGEELGQMELFAHYVTMNDTIHFEFKHDEPWEVGKYTADLYINNTFDRTIEFEVQ